jgi:cobalt/nickel transport system permease protein
LSINAQSLDRHIPGDSLIHGADPRVKVGVTFAFIAALTSLPVAEWAYLAGFCAALWAVALISGIGLTRLLKRTFIAIPFVLVALPSVFTRGGEALATWDIGFFTLTPTREGIQFVATLMFKSWTAVTAAALLAATTRYLDIIAALHWFRVPSLLVAVMAMMYRYIFLLVEEAGRLLTARNARSAAVEGYPAGGTVRWRAKVAGNMAGSLFIRTMDRSERVHMAMLARGYSGTASVRTLGGLRAADAVVFAALLGLLLAAALAARLV